MRLLIPGLIPLVMPMAVAMQEIKRFDTPKIKLSFIFSASIGFVLLLVMLDFGLLVLSRHPINVALGLETRQQYLARIQPGYADVLTLIENTPADAHIYFICEARTYEMERNVLPDSLNDNLPHDFFLYKNAEGIVSAWQKKGYTHILLARHGLDALRDAHPTLTPTQWLEETRLEKMLPVIAASEAGDFVLFAVPTSPN
jgi:hypothetical protein